MGREAAKIFIAKKSGNIVNIARPLRCAALRMAARNYGSKIRAARHDRMLACRTAESITSRCSC